MDELAWASVVLTGTNPRCAALVGYNEWMFGSILGGQERLERLHILRHGVSGPWSGNLAIGLTGTLFSPNRGLFVFSPWIAVALASLAIPAVARRLASHSLLCVLLASLVPYLLVLSKYSVWWGGHCFGPRYWTDVVPLFAIVFAFGLDWMRDRSVRLGGDLGRIRVPRNGHSVYWSVLLSQLLEHPTEQCRPSPRTALELAGHGAISLHLPSARTATTLRLT